MTNRPGSWMSRICWKLFSTTKVNHETMGSSCRFIPHFPRHSWITLHYHSNSLPVTASHNHYRILRIYIYIQFIVVIPTKSPLRYSFQTLPGGVELPEVPSMYLGGALFYLLLPAKTQTLWPCQWELAQHGLQSFESRALASSLEWVRWRETTSKTHAFAGGSGTCLFRHCEELHQISISYWWKGAEHLQWAFHQLDHLLVGRWIG